MRVSYQLKRWNREINRMRRNIGQETQRKVEKDVCGQFKHRHLNISNKQIKRHMNGEMD